MWYSFSKGCGAKPGRDRPERDNTKRPRKVTVGGHGKLGCLDTKMKQVGLPWWRSG